MFAPFGSLSNRLMNVGLENANRRTRLRRVSSTICHRWLHLIRLAGMNQSQRFRETDFGPPGSGPQLPRVLIEPAGYESAIVEETEFTDSQVRRACNCGQVEPEL